MNFLSIGFLILFSICFLLYCLLGSEYRNRLLLAASCFFIGWTNIAFLVTAIAISIFTFYWGIYLQRHNSSKVYSGGIAILLFLWIIFHYGNFVVGVLNPSFLSGGGYNIIHKLIFPLGMSFYIFQAIGYLTDIKWEDYKAEQNITYFMLYMLFFMKFLSGPIERAGSFISQLKKPSPFNYTNAVTGLKFILLGMIKKLLITNHISPYTAIMFDTTHDLSGVQLLMTCLIYPIELYADFSGYTDIAIGGAYMFGIRLSDNFNNPFSAKSTAELWRRWHMSLSYWVRDYLFFPISSAIRSWNSWGTYVALLITFVLLGLWHGIGFSFAIYGLIQGIAVCLEIRFKEFRQKLSSILGHRIADAVFIIRTYLLFALSLIFFRIDSVKEAFYFISHISFHAANSWKEINIGMGDHNCIVAGSTLLLVLIYEYFNVKKNLMQQMEKQPVWVRWSIYYLLIFALFSLGKFDNEKFIYLQF